jgi:hypothetical protein
LAALKKIQVESNSNSFELNFCPDVTSQKITLHYGCQIKIRFLIEVKKSISLFHVEVEFVDATLKGVAQCISINNNHTFKNHGGSTSVGFSLNSLPLNRGTYSLNLRIYSADFKSAYFFDPLCFYDNLLEIQVISDVLRLGGSPIQLDVDWSQDDGQVIF